MSPREDRKIVVFPSTEPADDVTGSVEAEVDQVARGQDRGVAVIADKDQLLFRAAQVPVAPRAVHGDAPLEHRPRDVQAPGYDSVGLTGILRADVDDDPAFGRSREGLEWLESGYPAGSHLDQTVQ